MTIKVGADEFCSTCMEWREYDEEGRCKVCKKIIKKQEQPIQRDSYDQYKTETTFEPDEESNDF